MQSLVFYYFKLSLYHKDLSILIRTILSSSINKDNKAATNNNRISSTITAITSTTGTTGPISKAYLSSVIELCSISVLPLC